LARTRPHGKGKALHLPSPGNATYSAARPHVSPSPPALAAGRSESALRFRIIKVKTKTVKNSAIDDTVELFRFFYPKGRSLIAVMSKGILRVRTIDTDWTAKAGVPDGGDLDA